MALSGGIVVGSNKCYNKSQIHLKHSSRVVFLLRCKNSILQHNVPISGYAMLVEASPAVSDFIMDGYFARAVPKVLLRRSISEYKASAAIAHRVQYTFAVLNREGENHSDILTKSHLLLS